MHPPVDADVALEVASHEALVRQTYKDSVGVLTWCVGMTNATGHTVERYIGRPQTVQHCMNIYAWALRNYAEHVYDVFAGHNLTKEQLAGILSFTWNLGGGNLRKASWVKHFKAGRMKDAERTFKLWNKAGGKRSEGLANRRAKEADLIFRGKWSNDGSMVEYTRLSKSMTVVWSSARRLNVRRELLIAFGNPGRVTPDQTPRPNAPVPEPTVTPNHSPNALLVLALFAAVVAVGGWVWRKVRGDQADKPKEPAQ